MSVRKVARLIALALGTVAVSVASNQVLNNGKLSWSWAYLSIALALLAECYAEVLAPRPPSVRSDAAPSAPGGALRGRRGVYLRQLRAHVRDMETTGIATQGEFVLRLRQVYVDVSLKTGTPQDAATAPNVGQRDTAEGRRRSLSSFLEKGGEGRVFAVLGGPGSGKTTLMRATTGDLCRRGWRRGWRRRRLPVLLYLRDHAATITADPDIGLADVAAEAGWVTGRTPASWIADRLERAGCLVMLDGLDEVADQAQRSAVVAWVRRQIDRYPGNDYLLTSRPHGYLSNPLAKAEVLQVRRFTAEQISQFLHSWYYAIECRATGTTGKQTRATAAAKADDLIRRLRGRPALYDLAVNPLLLTMIANVHRYRRRLPASRAELYGEMCQVLVHLRQESKDLPDPTGLSGHQKEHIMGVLALTMMDARLRDIPADEACAAIGPALADASPDLPASDLLHEVGKSGLLVEREHGRYAFAHLTLQEYLAATQIGEDASRLVDHVDDGWWRETTLLWSVKSDATSVISACLASGTVGALALAFDCAAEARSVKAEVRRRLDDLLSAPDDEADEEHRRLITAVKAARMLHEVIWIGEGTVMCARPVPRSLYAMFVRDDQARGRHNCMPGDVSTDADTDDTPVTGIWADDAARFVIWLNALFDDGTTYRVPTRGELGDPAIGLVVDSARHKIWEQAYPRPRLHRSLSYRAAGADAPYAIAPVLLRDHPVTDRERAAPFLILTLTALLGQNTDRALARGHVIAAALTEAVGRRDRFDGLRLIRGLVLGRALALTIGGLLQDQRDRDLDRAISRERIRMAAVVRNLPTGRLFDPVAATIPVLARVLTDTLNDARAAVHSDAVDIADALDRARHPADLIARAVEFAQIVNGDGSGIPSHDSARILLVGMARELDNVLVKALDLAILRDEAPDLGLILADDAPPDPRLFRDLRSDLIRDHDTLALLHTREDIPLAVRVNAKGEETPLVNADIALALDLAPLLHGARKDIAVTAFRCLLGRWASSRRKGFKPGAALTDFDTFLKGIGPGALWMRIPDDPTVPLARAEDRLDGSTGRPDPEWPQRNLVRALIADARSLVEPILDRTAPCDGAALACARLGLLAAAMMSKEAREDRVHTLLLDALRSLVLIEEQNKGRAAVDDVLLLVRA